MFHTKKAKPMTKKKHHMSFNSLYSKLRSQLF